MAKRVIVAGVLGAVALMVWTLVSNGIFGFNARLRMNSVQNERAVYEVLKANVIAPGAYVVNPEPVPEKGYPFEEPVFGLHYAGFGHEVAGRMALFHPAILLVSSLLVALLLSMTSSSVLSRYWFKVLFVVVIGGLFAVFGDLTKFEIGGYPARTALLIAAYDIVTWALAGLVIAAFMRAPKEAGGAV
jgi:hypothetical protein